MYSHSVYTKSPAALQSALISMRGVAMKWMREGKHYSRILWDIRDSQFLGDAELAAWRASQLGRLLVHAVKHVPFYRDLALADQLASTQAIEFLAAFPIIDKAMVREQGLRFMADTARRPLFKGSTSGTTGTPLVLQQDLPAINRENAFAWRQLEWAGLKRGDRRAWIRGDLVVPTSAQNPPFWRRNHAENMLMMSSYHLSDRHAAAYLDAMARFDPVVIQAYPSSIEFLAHWLEANDQVYSGKAIKGIVTSSETLDAEQKRLIERRFGCRVFDWYGQFERVAAIGTCEHGRQHIVSDYSFVELLPAEDGLYEIVGTGFNNFAMPLIRYRTGDYVQLEATDSQCECGRHFPLVASIQGRADDVVKLPDGRHVGRLDHIFKGVDGVLEAQIRQDRIDQIEILVVPTAGYGPAVEARLLAHAYERLGESVQISIRTAAGIERTRNGKLRGVVCNVK
jgi:phenylacetate-CoA ligase